MDFLVAFLEWFRLFENSVNCRFKEDLRSVTGIETRCAVIASLKFFKEKENRSHVNALLRSTEFQF